MPLSSRESPVHCSSEQIFAGLCLSVFFLYNILICRCKSIQFTALYCTYAMRCLRCFSTSVKSTPLQCSALQCSAHQRSVLGSAQCAKCAQCTVCTLQSVHSAQFSAHAHARSTAGAELRQKQKLVTCFSCFWQSLAPDQSPLRSFSPVFHLTFT